MEELRNMSHAELVDLLSQQTFEYTKMLRQGTNQEQYIRRKNNIDSIIAEIEKRKTANASTASSGKH